MLATRGEYLHLGHLSITDHVDDDDVDVGMLIVDEWTTDGTRKRSASFDPDALDAVTADAGHTWPNTPILEEVGGALGYTTTDVDATVDSWAFFQEHSLPT